MNIFYLMVNREKFAQTTDQMILWGAAVLMLGIFVVPYLHLRHLKGWSMKKSLVFVGCITLVDLVATIVQLARVQAVFSRFQGML
jgi:ABC-type uncharacterized transport system permease subunit